MIFYLRHIHETVAAVNFVQIELNARVELRIF